MQYWLMKSEPSEFSIDDLAALPNQTVEWFGVRNYLARNFMRDDMKIGDLVLFWHSSCEKIGIYGLATIASLPHPDSTQFNFESNYYDAKSNSINPKWWCVDVKLVCKTPYISIEDLRKHKQLQNMQVLKKGNRLSVTKVAKSQWDYIQLLIQKHDAATRE